MIDSIEAEDTVIPGDKWEFNEEVAKCFDQMLARSIPSYEMMRVLCYNLGKEFVLPDHSILDLGASRGEALRPFIEDDKADRFIAMEISEPMRNEMNNIYKDNPKVNILDFDLRKFKSDSLGNPSENSYPSLIMSILTIQFTPIEYRSRIIGAIYDMLPSGGAFIFVEKIIGATSRIDRLFVDEYYRMKSNNGYSQEDIDKKRSSLEGVLVPLTASANEGLLHAEGFNHLDCFYRNLNFAGWIAIK